jgi:thiol-disulfide isomerase/thioredoxin
MNGDNERQKFGIPLDDFVLPRISGESVSLSWSMEGKKGAIVLFWSSTCSHCVRYDSYLNTLEARYPDLRLLAVASRRGEKIEGMQKAIAERRLTFPILRDADGAVASRWFTQQTPRAFLMDPQRALLYRGAIDNFKYPEDPEFIAYLEPAIGQFLSGEPISKPETASYGCAIESVYYILPKML